MAIELVTNIEAKRIEKLWQEHQEALFPKRYAGVEIDGLEDIDLVLLDSDATGCISTYLSRRSELDLYKTAILGICYRDLARAVRVLDGKAREYFQRLEMMVGLVLRAVRNGTSKSGLAEKVRRRFTKELAQHGFERTKETFWVKPSEHFAQFVHLHLFSFKHGFRVHLGIRVMNDDFDAAALNGPTSDEEPGYRLDFGESLEETDRCVAGLLRYFVEVGLPWFEALDGEGALLTDPSSPLREDARDALEAAVGGDADPEKIEKSKTVLGLRSD